MIWHAINNVLKGLAQITPIPILVYLAFVFIWKSRRVFGNGMVFFLLFDRFSNRNTPVLTGLVSVSFFFLLLYREPLVTSFDNWKMAKIG